jgi:serine/threonine protein phosphatase PrpC
MLVVLSVLAKVILIYHLDSKGQAYGPVRVWNEDRLTLGIAMSRSMGDTEGTKAGIISTPDVSELVLKCKDKIVVIASDGVWEVISNEKVLEIVKEFYGKGKAEDAAKELVGIAGKEWRKISTSSDDITAIVIFLNNP